MNDERARTRPLAALLRLGLLAALGACTTPAPTPMAEPAPSPASPPIGPESGNTPTTQAAPTPSPMQAPAPAGSGGTAPSSRPCFDVRPAMVRCPAGEELTHAGCEGPDYMMHCAPKRKP